MVKSRKSKHIVQTHIEHESKKKNRQAIEQQQPQTQPHDVNETTDQQRQGKIVDKIIVYFPLT